MELSSLLYSLLVTGAGLSAASAVSEFAKGAGKAAFDALKARLSSVHNAGSVALLDQAKGNAAYEAVIKADLAKPEVAADTEVKRLAEELLMAIKALPGEITAAYAIDIREIHAGQNLLVEDVEGLRADSATSVGDMTFRSIRSPGGNL